MKKFYSLLIVVFFLSSGFVDMMSDCLSDGMTYYSLSDALKEPLKVKKLDISMQKLTSISPDIAKLENLECLDLSFNKIGTLPAEIGKLKHLKYLNLAGTRYIASIPDIVYQLDSLQILDIQDHPEWSEEKFKEVKIKLPNVRVIVRDESSGPVELK